MGAGCTGGAGGTGGAVWAMAPHVDPADRRRLDLVIYGAALLGGALCCDATLVSPLSRFSQPQPRAAEFDAAALRVAEKRKNATYPELSAGGPQRLVVLGAEVGGRWNDGAQRLLHDLVRLRARHAPPALRRAATSAWARRWSGMLAAAAGTALGPQGPQLATSAAGYPSGPDLDQLLHLAAAAGPSRLPLRP